VHDRGVAGKRSSEARGTAPAFSRPGPFHVLARRDLVNRRMIPVYPGNGRRPSPGPGRRGPDRPGPFHIPRSCGGEAPGRAGPGSRQATLRRPRRRGQFPARGSALYRPPRTWTGLQSRAVSRSLVRGAGSTTSSGNRPPAGHAQVTPAAPVRGGGRNKGNTGQRCGVSKRCGGNSTEHRCGLSAPRWRDATLGLA